MKSAASWFGLWVSRTTLHFSSQVEPPFGPMKPWIHGVWWTGAVEPPWPSPRLPAGLLLGREPGLDLGVELGVLDEVDPDADAALLLELVVHGRPLGPAGVVGREEAPVLERLPAGRLGRRGRGRGAGRAGGRLALG